MHIAIPPSPETLARELLLRGRSRLLPRLRLDAAAADWRKLSPAVWALRAGDTHCRLELSGGSLLLRTSAGLAAWIDPLRPAPLPSSAPAAEPKPKRKRAPRRKPAELELA